MDTLVSYRGGQSWRETLGAMLTPVGLASHEQGTTLTVSRSSVHQTAVEANAGVSTEPAISPAAHSSFLAPQSTPMVEAPSTDVPSFNISSADGWSAERGDTLHKVLTEWCRRSNVELQWLAEYDYPIEGSTHFNASFEDAVRGLLAGFDQARPQPIGELHTNSIAGQKVLVVQVRGNNYTN